MDRLHKGFSDLSQLLSWREDHILPVGKKIIMCGFWYFDIPFAQHISEINPFVLHLYGISGKLKLSYGAAAPAPPPPRCQT